MTTTRDARSILVVEDEQFLRELTVEQLEQAGYAVIETATVDEALKVLKSGAAIGLVFTDVNTPGDLDGLQLANLVRESWPDVRVIVTSGGGVVAAKDVMPPGRFMPKPYSFFDIVAAVRSLTEGQD
jgi:DNA-binding NtrC family response regulator